MKQKSIVIAAVLAITMLTAVFTTTPPFSTKDAEGQTIPLPICPVGYERNILGTCVPIVVPVPGSGGSSETESLTQKQKGVASGEGEVDNCEVMSINSPTGGTQCTGDTEVP